MKTYDVIVAGGGIIGAAVALRLAQRKLRIALLDQGQPGREASWAAAGMLSPVPENAASIPLVPLARASLDLYPAFIAEIEELTGRSTGYRRKGSIELLFSAEAERELSTMIALHHGLGFATEPLPLDEAQKLEPAMTRHARAAAFLPYEGSVNNRALTETILEAAQREGVEVRANTQVSRLSTAGHRCTGVTAGGETLSGGQVVLAAGAFCARIQGLLPQAPTRPIRGQMVAFRSAGARIGRPIRCERGYIVPRDDAAAQWIVAGTTVEDTGFEKHVTARGVEGILSAAQELVPGLADAEVIEMWSGLRPDSPDHLPLLGPTELEGVTLATGHYRNGILLAPVTAKLVCEWITERRVSMDWETFSPLRFAAADTARQA